MNLKEQGREYRLNKTAIYDMLNDEKGNIWCNNSLGIAQYKINQQSFCNYSLANYELSTTNKPFIYLSPNSDRYCIGQSNSFLLFDHTNNSNDTSSTNLLFNDCKIYNTCYHQTINDSHKIILNYK